MIKNCGKLNDTHSNTTTSYFITVGNSRCVKGFDKKTSIFINIRNKSAYEYLEVVEYKIGVDWNVLAEKALQTNNSNPTI